MIDGSEKRNRQLAFELQNSHVCEKRSKGNKMLCIVGEKGFSCVAKNRQLLGE